MKKFLSKKISLLILGILFLGSNVNAMFFSDLITVGVSDRPNKRLFEAVIDRNYSNVKLALGDGANINAKNVNGQTVLSLAVMIGLPVALKLVELFLQNGADPKMADRYGNTPLSVAEGKARRYNDPIAQGVVLAIKKHLALHPLRVLCARAIVSGDVEFEAEPYLPAELKELIRAQKA